MARKDQPTGKKLPASKRDLAMKVGKSRGSEPPNRRGLAQISQARKFTSSGSSPFGPTHSTAKSRYFSLIDSGLVFQEKGGK